METEARATGGAPREDVNTARASRVSIRAAVVALVLITTGTFALRSIGLGSSLPHLTEADAIVVKQARQLERGAPRMGTGRISALYPHLLAVLLDALPGRLVEREPAEAPVELHLRAASRPYLRARELMLALSLLALPATWWIARRFLSPGQALVALLLVATSFTHDFYARQARPHGPLTAFCALTVASALWMSRSRNPWSFVSAGLCAGLALSSLHSGSAALLPLVAGLVVHRASVERPRRWLLLLPLAIAGAMGAMFYPFLFEGEVWAGREHVQAGFGGKGFGQVAAGLWGYDPVLCVLSALGSCFALARLARRDPPVARRTRLDLAIVLAFVAPYGLAIGLFNGSWVRFAVLLVPFLAIAGAYGLARTVEVLARAFGAPARRIAPAAVLLALALPAWIVVRVARLRAAPDSAERAARWIEEHADRERDTIAESFLLNLPLLRDREGLVLLRPDFQSPLQTYQKRLDGERATERGWHLRPLFLPAAQRAERGALSAEEVGGLLAELDPRYAVLIVPFDRREATDGTRDAVLARGGELRWSITPFERESIATDDIGDELGREGLRWAATALCPGPALEIYVFR